MKKSRIMVVAAVLAVVSMVAAVAVSCRSKKEFELSFVTNGGTEIQSVKVAEGESYTLPAPQRNGYEFDGWYLTADFSGSAVEALTVSEDKVFYAKWAQLFKVSLELNGGTLSVDSLSLKAGADLYQTMQAYTPEKSGLSFGAWFDGSSELTPGTLMPQADLTLTAQYKVAYRVELYLQALDSDEYVKAEEDLSASDYVGVTVRPNHAISGFISVDHASAVPSKVLTETASENVLRLYYDRRTYRVSFDASYPDGTQSEVKTVDVRYGEQIEVPTDYEAEGYYLFGWSARGDVVYKTNLIQSLLYNGDGQSVAPETITPEGNVVLTAVWSKGYVDMFGGQDYIFLDPENDEICYLARSGIYFSGTFNADTKEFLFRDSNREILLRGRLNGSDSYSYRDLDREGYASTLYTVGSGLDENVTIYFDAYNGITYSVKGEDGTTDDSEGTYLIDENGYYIATFTSGTLSGQELMFRLGTVSGTAAFQPRNEEEVNLGVLVRFGINNGSVAVYSSYQLILNGFGDALFNTGSVSSPNWQSYYYTCTSELNQITLLNSQGSVEAVASIMESNGQKGYMIYWSELDHTFEAASGATLTLDGLYNAVYKNGSETVSGYYTMQSSVLGGYIVTLTSSGNVYTFLTSTVQTTVDVGDGQTEPVTTYHFEVKPTGYAEYYYQNSESIYYAPLIVLNDESAGRASLYGYTASRTYEKVSSGVYQYDANTGKYSYTAEEYFDAPNVSTALFDLPNIKVIVFAVDSTTNTVSVNYWYTVTMTDGTTDELPVSVYTEESGATLTLIAGFAILSVNGSTLTGTYSTSNGLTSITVSGGVLYVELNDEDQTFTLVSRPYTCYELKADGTASRNDTLSYDGKGNATYASVTEIDGVQSTVSYVGKVTDSGETTAFGSPIYVFTAEGMTFQFLQLTASSTAYFTKWNEEYNGEYLAGDSQLILDGFGFQAEYYNGASGESYTGMYFISADNVVCMIMDGAYRYFDILENKAFTLRGEEYGTYLLTDNQNLAELYLEFDGYGRLSVFTIVTDTDGNSERQYLDENGTYVSDGAEYTLTYTNGSESVTLIGQRSTMTISSTVFNVFVIAHKEVKRTYVNEKDWSVLVLDELGNATKYDTNGIKESGTYVLVTDGLLYYVNAAATDACIYEYDNAKGTATPITFRERAYYSEKLDSMQFSKYGFAIFNGVTRYYYNIEDGDVVIYRRANAGEDANEYGFVRENFGTFENEKVYDGITYYMNSGYAITFKRAEESKDEYPVLVSQDNKQPLQNLLFTPTGSTSFSVSGTVIIDGRSYSCVVTRNESELYLTIGYYRFDLSVKYGGENEDGSSNSTYQVTRMRWMNTMPSYQYLYMYYMIYAFYGSSVANTFPNTYGVISIVQEFDVNGEETESYVEGQFGESSNLTDSQGNIVSIKAPYTAETIGTSTLYTVEFEAEDGYLYRLYFLPGTVSSLGTGYRVYAFNRVETLSVGSYTVEVERIIASENTSFTAGSFFNVTLKENGEVIEATNIYILSANEIYYIVRAENEDGKYASALYYKIALTAQEDSGSIEEPTTDVVPLAAVTVTTESVTTLYAADGASYADIGDTSGVLLVSNGGRIYLIKTCAYEAATSTYTAVTSSGKTFTVKVTETEGVRSVEITEVVETEESEPEAAAA